MLKKFLSGMMFGLGFSVAALFAYSVWIFVVLPSLIEQGLNSEPAITESSKPSRQFLDTPDFHDLPLDEKIKKASAIIIVKFEEGEGDSYKSIVEDVLKKKEGVELYYSVGEVYEYDSHYKLSEGFVPKRSIIFMQGNPATIRFSTTFEGERIIGLGGISLALLREKCNDT